MIVVTRSVVIVVTRRVEDDHPRHDDRDAPQRRVDAARHDHAHRVMFIEHRPLMVKYLLVRNILVKTSLSKNAGQKYTGQASTGQSYPSAAVDEGRPPDSHHMSPTPD
jgi:hypothetical protein